MLLKTEEAYSSTQKENLSSSRYWELAPKEVCKDTSHMEAFFQDVMDKAGEGIILRDPSAPLQSGRSAGYLKHKVWSNMKKTIFTLILFMWHTKIPKKTKPTQKYRDGEAKIIRKIGVYQWECEL